jgi:hypothetical protein
LIWLGSFILQNIKQNKQTYTLAKLVSELEIGVVVLLGSTGRFVAFINERSDIDSPLSQLFFSAVAELRKSISSEYVRSKIVVAHCFQESTFYLYGCRRQFEGNEDH